jgi:hypothetical protein
MMVFRLKHPIAATFLCFSTLLAACTSTTAPVTPAQNSVATAEATKEATAAPQEGQGEAGQIVTSTQSVTNAEPITATEVVTGATAGEPSTGCPQPTSDSQLISNTVAGYCFLIPATFERSADSGASDLHLIIDGPATTPGHRERAFIDVTNSSTQTLDAVAQAVVTDVLTALPTFTSTQQSLTWGGVPAVQLEPLPGQDLSRKVLALTNDRLYTLTFVPLDPSQSEASAEMEQLYALMADSFHFMTPTVAASSAMPLLTWEGDINGACTTLTISEKGEAAVGPCGGAASSTATLAADNAEWVAVQQQFGDINADTSAGKITFHGQGNTTSDEWAQALATWASFTAMETQAGRSSAALRTALAWQLTDTPEHSGQCSQLIVLAYGYAYANQIPCTGSGNSTPVAMGWLIDSELDTFMDWLNNGARVEDKAGYLDAKGTKAITPEEISNWANGIYNRLIQ